MSEANLSPTLRYILSAAAVRERCTLIYDLGVADQLRHWQVKAEGLERAVAAVITTTASHYPSGDIPYHGRWRHINASRLRVAEFIDIFPGCRQDCARALFEMTTLSVLLDAGAGMAWRYTEPDSGLTYSKSEGLAVAAYQMFCEGYFTGPEAAPATASAAALADFSAATLQEGMQVSPDNPLVGVAGRTQLLQRLGQLILTGGRGFEHGKCLGELFDHIAARVVMTELAAADILSELLICIGDIWPGRLEFEGANLGDTWSHYALTDYEIAANLVPFHKLSQWLTYSLLEVFEFAGYKIVGLDALTGLPEYRNGGLLVDTGALLPRDPKALARTWRASDEWVIEWRALTVGALDQIAASVRAQLNVDAEQLPLAKVLEGGTWAAGRGLARARRPDGGPPFAIESDGTVF